MAVDIIGLIVVIFFYVVIFLIGIWAAWKRRKHAGQSDEAMLASRSLGPVVGLLTLTATWVGGGYINGSAEAIYNSGLIWCQAPIGYSVSLCLGGIFFAKKMREAGYVTMLDPLQNRFGRTWGSFLFFPALAGEMLWSAAILAALGTTLAVMLELNSTLSIIISAAIAVSYTLFGGLAAVAYTDVVQLFCIFIGLWITIPFALKNEHSGSISLSENDWIGHIPKGSYDWGEWTDYYLLMMFGGIPWQVYFQRVLASKNWKQAQVLSIAAAACCIVMVVPACIIGAIAKTADWQSTQLQRNLTSDDSTMILPLVIRHLTPKWVGYVGLGAVTAAVMSSADSSVLSSSSMFAINIYKNVIRPKAMEKEVTIVMRFAVVIFGSLSCIIAIYSKSVYALFYLCGDLVYVMLFPQLTLTVHAPNYVSIFGSIPAYFLGLLVRILGGEPVVGIPVSVKFPWFDEATNRQLFPFRTLAMLVTLTCLLLCSWLARKLNLDEDCCLWKRADGEYILPGSKNADIINGLENQAMNVYELEHNGSKVKARTEIATYKKR